MKIRFLLLLLCCAATVANAQRPAQQTTGTSQTAESQQTNRKREEIDRRFNELKSTGEYTPNIKSTARAAALNNVAKIYRTPNDKEMETLSVDKNDLRKHAAFLRQSETGLTRLMSDRGCAESPNVLYVAEECRKYQMPGAGSSFSFREKNYRLRRLSDLTYDAEGFRSSGILSHAILVNIGDAPLENISLQTKGLKFLTEFEAVTDLELARQADKKLTGGVESDGFFYSRSAEAKENSTYVLRVVAYRGNLYRAIDGLVYDEFDFDERRDVTVAFRIVSRDEQSVTILWKILSDQKAPAIKRPTRQQVKAEENKFTAEKIKAN